MKKISVILALSILIVGLFSVAATAEYKGEFRISNSNEPVSLDPHLTSSTFEHRIILALFENLISNNPEDATPVPGVAESWEISPDGKVYTFKLRKTVWSDGVPITAETFVKSWLRIMNPKTKASYGWFPAMFISGGSEFNAGKAGPENVKIKALDDYTLQMELVGPMPYVLGALAHNSFAPVPLHIIEKYGMGWIKPGRMASNGPFMLEEWKEWDKISCIPNPRYYDKETVKLARVIFFVEDNDEAAYKKFLKGELDWIDIVPLDQIESVRSRVDFYNVPYLGTYYLIFNCQKKPFDDHRVRKALSISIQRQELTKKITKAGEIASTALVPPIPGYKTIMGNKEDIELAKKLLNEAGFPGGRGFPKFKVLYNSNEINRKMGDYIQKQWKEILEIQCKPVFEEWKTYAAQRSKGDFDVARMGWIGDFMDPKTFLDLLTTNCNFNEGRYHNAEYDQLVEAAAKELDPQKRMEILTRAEEIAITRDQAIMPIYHYVSKGMIDTRKWGGWYPNILNLHPLKYVYLK